MRKTLLPLFTLLLLFSVTNISAQDEMITLKGDELFGSLSARHIGPALMSGRITDLEMHPTNNRIIYAGTAGGGVWKTTNGGATFNSIFDDYCQSIGTVALDPQKPDQIVWVGTGETWTRNSTSVGDGLYRSSDGGTSWKKMGFENSDRIASIVINPNNSDEVYVGVLGALWGDSDDRGIYKTTDGGATWNKLLHVNQTTGCTDLIMHPTNSNILYASFWEFRRTAWSFNSGGMNSALYKSIDGGATWNKIHNGFPAGKLGRIGIALAPSSPDILYAVIEAEKSTESGLYKSTDAGKNWELKNSDFGLVVRPFYFSRIVVDPKNPDVVVKGGLSGSLSRDGGDTFKAMGQMHSDIHDISFDINDSDRMYVATDGGIYRSWNGGAKMEIVENIPVSQFYHISVDNAEPYNVYGGLQDNGSWYGPNSAPGGVQARHWNSVGFGDGFRVLRHPTKNIIYSEMQGAANVWRYDADKKIVNTIQPFSVEGEAKLRFNWNPPIATSENNPDRLYIGSQYVHVSNDMGTTWKIISGDLTTNDESKQNQEESGGLSVDNSGAENHCTVFTIAESTLDEKIIWAGTDDGNVQVTKDGGKNWTNTTANFTGLPKNTWCYHIEASVHDKGTAYAVFDGHTTNDKTPYAYKTTDYGNTWTSIITDEVYGFVRNIQEDYVNEDLLFLGTEFGLYVTANGGKNWSKFKNNMPAAAVHFIDLQKQTNDLVMGTHGRGVIIIDDISPLRYLTQDVLAKKVHIFNPKPTEMYEEAGFSGSFGSETKFIGENPRRAAKLIYYLQKRHTFGKMKIEVFDSNGKFVTSLKPSKSKGINVVYWNFLKTPPKIAKGKTLSFAGFTSPRVPAGDYKIVMTKGKETYETSLTLNYADNGIPVASRKAQEALTEKLFNLTEDLAYDIYELDNWITAAEKLEKDDPGAKKMTQGLISKLNELKETMVITTGDNYVGTAENQLREKIADVYGKIAANYDKPSTSDLSTYESLKKLYNEKKAVLEGIRGKELKKMIDYMKKKEMTMKSMKSKEEFLKA